MNTNGFQFYPWQALCNHGVVVNVSGTDYTCFATPDLGASLNEYSSRAVCLQTGVPLDGLCLSHANGYFGYYVGSLGDVDVTSDIEIGLDVYIHNTAMLNNTLQMQYGYTPIIKGYNGTMLSTAVNSASTNADNLLLSGDISAWRQRVKTIGGMTIPAYTLKSKEYGVLLMWKVGAVTNNPSASWVYLLGFSLRYLTR